MQTKPIRWLKLALKDVDGVALWLTQNEDEEVARLVVDRIWKAAKSLEQFPNRGCNGKIKGTKELLVPKTSHYIVYRIMETEIQILRIIHNARNYPW